MFAASMVITKVGLNVLQEQRNFKISGNVMKLMRLQGVLGQHIDVEH